MTDSPEPAGEAVPNVADVYINALRAQRDNLEVTVAGLRHLLAAAEAQIRTLKAQLPAAQAAPTSESEG